MKVIIIFWKTNSYFDSNDSPIKITILKFLVKEKTISKIDISNEFKSYLMYLQDL